MKDKIKFYNKDIFKQENNIELTIILICVFLIRIYNRLFMHK